MDLKAWHGPGSRKTLVILGAGASRGANFLSDSTGPRSPLDADFFSELQRLPPTKESSKLLDFVRNEFGSSIGLSMEEFFSQVEYTDRFHNELNVDPGPKIKRYGKALDQFYRSLPMLFKSAVGDKQCDYHRRLAKLLYTDDVVMSFNYDCIIDKALIGAGRRWDPEKCSYGFRPTKGINAWRRLEQGKSPQKSIKLLKPHGSLNWKISSSGSVQLEKDPYSIETAKGRIVPPTWFKRLNEEPYASIWKEARLEIRKCRALIVIGYSVPQTDIFSRALFKAEIGSKERKQKLDLLIVVNPDKEARRRFVELVHRGIESRTRILEFNSFQDLARSFPIITT